MAEFLQTLLEIEKRCSDTVRVMAQGVLELKDMHDIDKQTEASIQYFLDRFYMSRIRYNYKIDNLIAFMLFLPII